VGHLGPRLPFSYRKQRQPFYSPQKNHAMRRKVLLSSFLFAGLLGLLWTSASIQPSTPGRTASEFYHEGLEKLEQAIGQLLEASVELDARPESLEQLQKAHLDCRKAFKRVEFLLEYFDPQAVKVQLNGAPLPKLEPNAPELVIIQPKGLQVLDELIFSDDPLSEKKEIVKLTTHLAERYERIKKYQEKIPIYDRHVFEAARYELHRIFALGLTGFDTPGSVNAIPEAVAALQSLKASLRSYTTFMDPEMGEDLLYLFDDAVTYLRKNDDFDTLDRLTFYQRFIRPLYRDLYVLQTTLGVETIDEVSNIPQPVNYGAAGLFEENFLNPYYYANLAPSAVTPQRIELGRLLFFDPILSDNNERACASCHRPELAFTDGQEKSMAFNFEGTIERNAPTVINSVYSERFFYDLRLKSFEKQMEHVVFNHQEFNTDFHAIVEKLGKSQTYQTLFEEAFPKRGKAISQGTIEGAITAYLVSLRGFNSEFDKYARGEAAELSESAMRGFNLFMGKAACGTCHFAPTFNGTVPPLYQESESEVLGVAADSTNQEVDADMGRWSNKILKEKADFYQRSFKTTTVRNVALTAPYMHNGAYHTLEQVLDFYNQGGGAGMGLDVPHQTLPDAPLNLTDQEQQDIITFMHALTDTTGMTTIPKRLPRFEAHPEWDERVIGGKY
jgi:cytochrome c peroxidase